MWRDLEDGAVSVEYALIAFLITVGIFASVLTFGTAVRDSFSESCTSIRTATATGAECR